MSNLSGVKVCQECGLKFVPRTTWQFACTKECYFKIKSKQAVEIKEKKQNENK